MGLLSDTTTPDPVAAYLAELRDLIANGPHKPKDNPLGARAREIDARVRLARLLAAVEAALAPHKPGRHVILGALCEVHESHRYFSITEPEAADVASCPDCKATVYASCAACGGAVHLDSCPVRSAITRALLGEDGTSV